jgi:hypothetical protein
MIVADVDGTLIGEDRSISPRVKQAVREAREHGVEMALSTGRAMFSAKRFADALGLTGFQIVDSGATIVDFSSGHVLFQDIIPPETCLRLLEACRRDDVHLEMYTAEYYYVEEQDENSAWQVKVMGLNPRVMPLDQLVAEQPIVKLEIITGTDVERQRLRALEAQFAGLLTFAWSTAPGTPVNFVNIMSPRINKGAAVIRLAEHLSIPTEQIMGIGDGENDESLLAAVGFPVAMGDAPESVKRLAKWVTTPVHEDGLALAIDRFVLGRSLKHSETFAAS